MKKKGKYNIIYSFIGLRSVEKSINLESDLRINISLEGVNSDTYKRVAGVKMDMEQFVANV